MFKFIKLHTSGNVFLILFDKIKKNFLKQKINKKLGIWCDQFFFIDKIHYKLKIIKIKIFNNNLNQAENCGNGIRCLSWYFLLKKNDKKFINFLLKKNVVYSFKKNKKNYIIYKFPKKKIKIIFRFNNIFLKGCFVDLLNLHIVFIISNIKSNKINTIINIFLLNFGDIYNIEFVQIINYKNFYIRIFERNVGETYSCGSGIISSCYYLFCFCNFNSLLFINSIGGYCNVYFYKKYIFYFGKEKFICLGSV